MTDLVAKLQAEKGPQSLPNVAEVPGRFVHDQTEHVYRFLYGTTKGGSPSATRDQLAVVFQLCLRSYEKFAVFIKEHSTYTPDTLFAQ